jgi:hypothetical protein
MQRCVVMPRHSIQGFPFSTPSDCFPVERLGVLDRRWTLNIPSKVPPRCAWPAGDDDLIRDVTHPVLAWTGWIILGQLAMQSNNLYLYVNSIPPLLSTATSHTEP